jgi:hypothetical protein
MDTRAHVTLIQLRFRDDDLAALDQWRRQQDDPPTRPQAALEIIRGVIAESTASTAGVEVRP